MLQTDYYCKRQRYKVDLSSGTLPQIGKTSLMVKYVEGSFDEDYIQTLGVK